MNEMLQEELRTFETQKKELLEKARGKFALIKGHQIVSVFDTETDAVRQGYERLGNVPFLVKEIVEYESSALFTSDLLGI